MNKTEQENKAMALQKIKIYKQEIKDIRKVHASIKKTLQKDKKYNILSTHEKETFIRNEKHAKDIIDYYYKQIKRLCDEHELNYNEILRNL